MLQMGDTVGPRYTARKISAISYLFRTFSLLIMGDTERPRYTGFRGLSVRGITALQCSTCVPDATYRFQGHQSIGSGEEAFLPYMWVGAILVM